MDMLSKYPTHTTIPSSDVDRSRAFYEGTLGFVPASVNPGGVFYESGGSRFLVFPSAGAGTSGGTVMGWRVEDIRRTVSDLKERRVTFLEYDTPDLKTEGSIATTRADPGGVVSRPGRQHPGRRAGPRRDLSSAPGTTARTDGRRFTPSKPPPSSPSGQ
jgi:catechol 2,3-dioxygenase-like lactoylglutathione lyase family enzyme